MSDLRLKQVKAYLKTYNLQYILISDPISARYVSGFKSSNTFLLVSQRTNILFTDFRYKSIAESFCIKNTQWKFILIEGSGFNFLKKHIKLGSKIGVQSDTLTMDQVDSFRKIIKKCTLKKMGIILSEINCVKSKQEINAMQKAAAIGDLSIKLLLEKIDIGMTEKSIANLLDSIMLENGSEKPSFDSIVLVGSRTALPHGVPTNKKIKKNDLILFDFGCVVDGFCSDCTRTVVIGKAKKRQKHIYDIVLRANEKAKSIVYPDIKIAEIDNEARGIIEKAGYGKYFGHSTGHGIGLRIHEQPRVYKNEKSTLKENMVFTIEPGIYLPGFGGVRIEDLIVVGKKGFRSLTHAPRELLEL